MRTTLSAARLAVLALLCALPFARPALAQDDPAKALPAMEKALWAAWAKGDAAPFEKHLAQNTINVNAARIEMGKAKTVDGIKKGECKVASHSLSDIQVTRFGDSTAILTYTATQDATCAGRKLPGKVHVSSVWVREGGQWLGALYHETGAGM